MMSFQLKNLFCASKSFALFSKFQRRSFSNRVHPELAKFVDATNLSSDKNVMKVYDEIILKPLNYSNEVPYGLTGPFIRLLNNWMNLPEEKIKFAEEIISKVATNWFMYDLN
jgi:hypothetical protein